MHSSSSESVEFDDLNDSVLGLLGDSVVIEAADPSDVATLSVVEADASFKSVCEQLQQSQTFAEQCIVRMNALKDQRHQAELALLDKEERLEDLQSAWKHEKSGWAIERKEMQETVSKAHLREIQLLDTVDRMRLHRLQQSVLLNVERNGRMLADKALQVETNRYHEKLQSFQVEHQSALDRNAIETSLLHDRLTRISRHYERQQLWKEDTRSHKLEADDEVQKSRWFRAHTLQKLTALKDVVHSLSKDLIDLRYSFAHHVLQTRERLMSYQPQLSSFAELQTARRSHVSKLEARGRQLEERLRNERKVVAHVDNELKKTIRLRERNENQLKAKLEEQKEFFSITIALKNGLLAELHERKHRFLALEKEFEISQRAKAKAVRTCWNLKQQISAMQQGFLREMEKYTIQHQRPQQSVDTIGTNFCWTTCGTMQMERLRPH